MAFFLLYFAVSVPITIASDKIDSKSLTTASSLSYATLSSSSLTVPSTNNELSLQDTAVKLDKEKAQKFYHLIIKEKLAQKNNEFSLNECSELALIFSTSIGKELSILLNLEDIKNPGKVIWTGRFFYNKKNLSHLIQNCILGTPDFSTYNSFIFNYNSFTGSNLTFPTDLYSRLDTNYSYRQYEESKATWEKFLISLYRSYKHFISLLPDKDKNKYQQKIRNSLSALSWKMQVLRMYNLMEEITSDFEINIEKNIKLITQNKDYKFKHPELVFWSTLVYTITNRKLNDEKFLKILANCLGRSSQIGDANPWMGNKTTIEYLVSMWHGSTNFDQGLEYLKIISVLFDNGLDLSKIDLTSERLENSSEGTLRTSLTADLISAIPHIGDGLLNHLLKTNQLNLEQPIFSGQKVGNENNRLYPIHLACINKLPKVLKLFLDLKVDPNQKDYLGRTALHYAAITNDLGSAKLLLSHLATEVNIQDIYGHTPLTLASWRGNIEIVRMLLALLKDKNTSPNKKIDINLRTLGPTPYAAYELAAKYGHTAISDLILSLNPTFVLDTRNEQKLRKTTPLLMAIDLNNLAVFNTLINTPNVNLEEIESEGTDYARHPITAISARGLTKFATALMELGPAAKITPKQHERICTRFIQFGTQYLRPDIVAMAIKAGGNIHATFNHGNRDGQTPLMVATKLCGEKDHSRQISSLEIVKMLLKHPSYHEDRFLPELKKAISYARKSCSEVDQLLDLLVNRKRKIEEKKSTISTSSIINDSATNKDSVISKDPVTKILSKDEIKGQPEEKKNFDPDGIHYQTKTFFDEEGYDYQGYDEFGFNRKGRNKFTGTEFDPQGYKRVLLNDTTQNDSSVSSSASSGISSSSVHNFLYSSSASASKKFFFTADNKPASLWASNLIKQFANFRIAKYQIALQMQNQLNNHFNKESYRKNFIYNLRIVENAIRQETQRRYTQLSKQRLAYEKKTPSSINETKSGELVLDPRMVCGFFPFPSTLFKDSDNYSSTIIKDMIKGINTDPDLKLGSYLANIIAEYNVNFIRRHAKIWESNKEFSQITLQLLKERFYLTLNLDINYPLLSNFYEQDFNSEDSLNPFFSIPRVLDRFLNGEEGSIVFRHYVNLEKYEQFVDVFTEHLDTKKLLDLIMLEHRKGNLPNQLLRKHALKYYPEAKALFASNSSDNEYFCIFNNKNNQRCLKFKEKFFIDLLDFYGFFIKLSP